MKLLLCFGTRPEAIKMAPICRELKRRKMNFSICLTGQHREMLDQVLDFFQIYPDFDLNLMSPDQSLNHLGGKTLLGMERVLQETMPDFVLVQGDTTTAALASLAAFHKGITVGHVEAGLRTYNKTSPFPEEVNRQIISKIADLHFAPTERAVLNLQKEDISPGKIFMTGNTIVDALEWAKERLGEIPSNEEINGIKRLLEANKRMILVTGHRRESFGEGLKNICFSLLKLVEEEEVEIIFPVHLNPNIKGPVTEILGNKKGIHLIKPVAYPSLLWLLKKCSLVISDSGGIQEEAPSFGKLVLVTRNVSERMEGVKMGFSKLVGTEGDILVREVKEILKNSPISLEMKNPYGDGKASRRIVEVIHKKFFDHTRE